MHFLPSLDELTLYHHPLLICGLILLLGLPGAKIARSMRFMPVVSGYILLGFLMGPGGLNIIEAPLLGEVRIFIEIALGIILFELGKHLDLEWLRHDKGLIRMSMAEAGFTFFLVLALLFIFKIPWLPALLVATAALMSSPAIIMVIAHDLESEGPVTRRTLMLTSLNNLIGLILFTVFMPLTHVTSFSFIEETAHIAYLLGGSLVIGIGMFYLFKIIAHVIGKYKESQFILVIGIIMVTLSLTHLLHLSPFLSLFSLGVFTRNFDKNYVLQEIRWGWTGSLFVIFLFVVTGMNLNFHGLLLAPILVIAFILTRVIAKMGGVLLFAKASRLTRQQMFSISIASLPMAGMAVGMTYLLGGFDPHLGAALTGTLAAVVGIFTLFAPILTQLAFIAAGETAVNQKI